MGSLFWGTLFFVGGTSGQLALVGTNSPEALAGVGAIFIGIGVIRILSTLNEAA